MDSKVYKQLMTKRFNTSPRILTSEKKYNINDLIKMKLGKKLIQNVNLGQKKKGSLLSSTFSSLSKVKNKIQLGFSGERINKPLKNFNQILKSIDENKDIMNSQEFNIENIEKINFFNDLSNYSLNKIFYTNTQNLINIIPRINYNLFIDIFDLKLKIPRTTLLTQNTIEVIFNNKFDKSKSEADDFTTSFVPLNQLLFILTDSISQDNYKNNNLINYFNDFYINLEYLKKKQTYVNDLNKLKISRFINNFIKLIINNYQNNIDFIRFLINKYCNLFGIYLINYNYIELYNKLSSLPNQGPIKFDVRQIKTLTKEIIDESNYKGFVNKNIQQLINKPQAYLSGQKYSVQNSIKISDKSLDPVEQFREVLLYEWENFYKELNKYFVIEKREYNTENIKKLGKDLISLLFFNIFNASNFINKLLTLFDSYKNPKINTKSKLDKLVTLEMKEIYKKIINKLFIPVRKETIKNEKSLEKLFYESNLNLNKLIDFYRKDHTKTEYDEEFLNYQQLLIKALQNINILYNTKLVGQNLRLKELDDMFCRLIDSVKEKYQDYIRRRQNNLAFILVKIFNSKNVPIININIKCQNKEAKKEIIIFLRTYFAALYRKNMEKLISLFQTIISDIKNYKTNGVFNLFNVLCEYQFLMFSAENNNFNTQLLAFKEKIKSAVQEVDDKINILKNIIENKPALYYDTHSFGDRIIKFNSFRTGIKIINSIMEFINDANQKLNKESKKKLSYDIKTEYNILVNKINPLFKIISDGPHQSALSESNRNLIKAKNKI